MNDHLRRTVVAMESLDLLILARKGSPTEKEAAAGELEVRALLGNHEAARLSTLLA